MKRVIITGGSRGIGRAAVELFAAAGDSVAFLYRSADTAAQEVASLTGAIPEKCDVGDEAAVPAAIAEAVSALGGVDVLVTAAGVAYKNFFDATDEAAFRRLHETNVGGTYRCIREVLPHMIREKRGSIVTLSSIWGEVGASMEVAYSSTKASIIGMTRALSKEVAPSGVRVNCVSPGVIDTDMNADLSGDDRASLAEEIPLGRFGTAAEVARAIYFLASEDASYITGQVLGVDGGFGR